MAREITLSGGGPWGFTLSGGKDFGAPLKVSKVGLTLIIISSRSTYLVALVPVLPVKYLFSVICRVYLVCVH